MESKIAESIALELSPAAVLFTDDRPENATEFKEGSMGCVASMLKAAAKGRVCVFSRKTSGCPGGGTGLGFGNCYVGFPIDRLLSTGGKADLPNGAAFDMGEGERFHASPEITERWIDALPFREAPTEYIAFKPLQLVSGEERPSLVVMFVNPDQLAALVTLAGFRTGALNASVAPWGAACQSMLFAHAEAEKERPAGVIGFFDISQRGKVARDILTYTMPYRLFLEMEDSVEDSFLRTHAWLKIKGRT